MLTEQIEMFLETADALCFSTVAKKRFTTQPTISRQISALEEEWGLKLFIRTNKGLRLTPEGTIMLACCQKMKQQCEESLKRARELTVGKNARLRLGFLELMDTDRIFMPFLRDFAREYTDLDISISSHSFGKLREGLQKGEFDIIYTFDFERANMQGDIVANILGEVKPVFVLSKYHPLYEKKDLHITDCAAEIFYLPESKDAPGREETLQMILRAHGIKDGKIRYVQNLDSVLFQMQAGKGIALMDTSFKDLYHPSYRLLEFEHYRGSLNIMSAWRKDNLNPFLPLLVNHQTVRL